ARRLRGVPFFHARAAGLRLRSRAKQDSCISVRPLGRPRQPRRERQARRAGEQPKVFTPNGKGRADRPPRRRPRTPRAQLPHGPHPAWSVGGASRAAAMPEIDGRLGAHDLLTGAQKFARFARRPSMSYTDARRSWGGEPLSWGGNPSLGSPTRLTDPRR